MNDSQNTTRKYIDWENWNKVTYQRIDFWLNKYDRGECIETYVPPSTGNENISPQPNPYSSHCPKIDLVSFLKCSYIEVFFS